MYRISVSQQQLEHESQLLITSQSQKELLSKKVDDMQRDLTKLEDKCLKQEAKIQQLNSEKFQLQNQIDLFDCEFVLIFKYNFYWKLGCYYFQLSYSSIYHKVYNFLQRFCLIYF